MENCLVTKLEGSVTNDLLKLGELRFTAETLPATIYCNIANGKTGKVSRYSGDLLFDGETSADMPVNQATSFSVTGTYGVGSVSNKYGITQLTVQSGSAIFNIKDFEWCQYISTISCKMTGEIDRPLHLNTLHYCIISPGSTCKITIQNLFANVANKQVKLINLRSPGITGDFAELARILPDTDTTSKQNITHSGITGSIKSFVQAKRAYQTAAGETPSGSVLFEYLEGAKITLDGTTPVTTTAKQLISWTSNTMSITYNDGEPVVIPE